MNVNSMRFVCVALIVYTVYGRACVWITDFLASKKAACDTRFTTKKGTITSLAAPASAVYNQRLSDNAVCNLPSRCEVWREKLECITLTVQ